MKLYFLFTLILWVSWSCDQPETAKPVSYTGPLREMENVEMLYTEKQTIKVKLQAKKIFEFQNGDQEFPDGLYLEFYDEAGRLTSTLQANTAFFFKSEEKWRGRGKVEEAWGFRRLSSRGRPCRRGRSGRSRIPPPIAWPAGSR